MSASTLPEENSKIAFTSDRDGNYEIYVMDAADGSNPTRLTDNTAFDGYPSWSPDGTKIAFTSGDGNGAEIYVMDAADGNEQIRLTDNFGNNAYPSWSPDGTKIAFTSYGHGGGGEIFVMDAAAGSNPTRLTDNTASDEFPDWAIAATDTQPPPPAQAIDELISDVQTLEGVSQSTKTSLTAPIRQASDLLNDDNPENDISACGRLDAFIREVNTAERRGTLTEDQANDLRTQAADIRTELGC